MVYAEKYVQKQRFTRAYVDTVKRENKKSEDSAEEKTLACESAQKKKTCREKKKQGKKKMDRGVSESDKKKVSSR